jgi:hypothetical protein
MHGNRNIITKGVVVEQVDAEEEHNVDEPAPNWHLIWSDKEWGSGGVELRNISRDSDEEKLHKSQERPYNNLVGECLFEYD